MKSGSLVKPFFFVALPVAVLALLLIYVGIEVYAHLTTSSRFAVAEVEVLNEGPADKKEILRLADIKIGSNIFSLDLSSVQHAVEKYPWVASATVSRALPDKIQIRYRAQVPVAILGAESLYYLNQEGVPFYKINTGDSLAYPLLHLETGTNPQSITRERIVGALKLLGIIKKSSWLSPKDLGDITIRESSNELSPPFLLTLGFPIASLGGKAQNKRHFTMSLAADELEAQINRAEVVLRHLVQASKNPRLIRLELGKKVVVKIAQ